MDYLKTIEQAINPPITEQEIKDLMVQLTDSCQGEIIYFTFRGERMSVVCENSALHTACAIMEKIGFDDSHIKK